MAINQELLEQLAGILHFKKSKEFYSQKLGITIDHVEELLKELKGAKEEQEESESVKRVNNEKGTIESTLEINYEPKNDIELAKLHKIDLTKYKISTYWSKMKGGGKFTSSVLASLKKPADYNPEDFAKFLSNWEPHKFYRSVTNYPEITEKEWVDVELNIADFHLAKKTVQGDSLDSKTFDYYNVVNELIGRVKSNYNISKIVFPISNDFFHSDNIQNTTTNGTPQDVTAWYDEEYERGFDILANTINFLLTQAKEVEIILVQGNHDRTKGFYVAHALEVFFKGYKQVKFQRHHSTTKAVVLGNTFIGYHHGNSCKIQDLPLLFATVPEFSKDFGNAKYREVKTADKHHYMALDVKGVRIQQMPSLSGDDRWHIDNNFINSVRAGLAFVYHPIKGRIAEFEERV